VEKNDVPEGVGATVRVASVGNWKWQRLRALLVLRSIWIDDESGRIEGSDEFHLSVLDPDTTWDSATI
jgi:hypothetical protein